MKRRKLTRRQLANHVGVGFLVAITAAGVGIAATHVGWLIPLTALAAVVLVYGAVRALRRANRQAGQIFDDELGNPDPFRGQHGNNPTDTTGETQ